MRAKLLIEFEKDENITLGCCNPILCIGYEPEKNPVAYIAEYSYTQKGLEIDLNESGVEVTIGGQKRKEAMILSCINILPKRKSPNTDFNRAQPVM